MNQMCLENPKTPPAARTLSAQAHTNLQDWLDALPGLPLLPSIQQALGTHLQHTLLHLDELPLTDQLFYAHVDDLTTLLDSAGVWYV